jgi:hypothetical protein
MQPILVLGGQDDNFFTVFLQHLFWPYTGTSQTCYLKSSILSCLTCVFLYILILILANSLWYYLKSNTHTHYGLLIATVIVIHLPAPACCPGSWIVTPMLACQLGQQGWKMHSQSNRPPFQLNLSLKIKQCNFEVAFILLNRNTWEESNALLVLHWKHAPDCT